MIRKKFKTEELTIDGRIIIPEIVTIALMNNVKLHYLRETEEAFACFECRGSVTDVDKFTTEVHEFHHGAKGFDVRTLITRSKEEHFDEPFDENFSPESITEEEVEFAIIYLELARVFISKNRNVNKQKAQWMLIHALDELNWENFNDR